MTFSFLVPIVFSGILSYLLPARDSLQFWAASAMWIFSLSYVRTYTYKHRHFHKHMLAFKQETCWLIKLDVDKLLLKMCLLVSIERTRYCIFNVILANRSWPFLQDKKLVFLQSSLHQDYAAQNLSWDPSKHSICSKSQEVPRTHKKSSFLSYRDRSNYTLQAVSFRKCNLQFGVLKDSSSNVKLFCRPQMEDWLGTKRSSGMAAL